jgi:hypothetical protein
MILSIPLCNYNKQYIILLPPVKNNMMEGGTFIRIIYSPPNLILNGIYIHIKNENVQNLIDVEQDILSSYITTKRPVSSIVKSISKYSKNTIKISGFWENDTTYGLVYKLI